MLAAVCDGDAKKLAELMKQDPGFNVNMALDGEGWTLLHHACWESKRSPVIPLFLAHPDIDVNVKDSLGYTPVFRACFGRTSCFHGVLKDSRVKMNEPRNDGCTPLWFASANGHLEVIRWWIASGREMDIGTPGDISKTDAIRKAKKNGKKEVATLLERFKKDASQTRHAMRVELGWYDGAAAEMFALAVFVSDGILQVKDTTPTPAARFFSIARRLPLELQMIVCHLVVGSAKETISGNDSEVAFKSLARTLLWSSFFAN